MPSRPPMTPPDYLAYLRRTVPPAYHVLAAVSKSVDDSLPRDRGSLNHSIDVLPGSRPPAERVRPASLHTVRTCNGSPHPDFDHDDSLVPATTRAVADTAEGSYDTVMDQATPQIATRRNQRDSPKCRRLGLVLKVTRRRTAAPNTSIKPGRSRQCTLVLPTLLTRQ